MKRSIQKYKQKAHFNVDIEHFEDMHMNEWAYVNV